MLGEAKNMEEMARSVADLISTNPYLSALVVAITLLTFAWRVVIRGYRAAQWTGDKIAAFSRWAAGRRAQRMMLRVAGAKALAEDLPRLVAYIGCQALVVIVLAALSLYFYTGTFGPNGDDPGERILGIGLATVLIFFVSTHGWSVAMTLSLIANPAEAARYTVRAERLLRKAGLDLPDLAVPRSDNS